MAGNYYGVQRSQEYLAHYGVKGMKWGVRKAKDSGNSKRLDKHWKKANFKLKALKRKADLVGSSRDVDSGKSIAKSMAAATLGSGLAMSPFAFSKKLNGGDPRMAATAGILPTMMAGIGAIGAGQAFAGKRRMTSKGHAKALQKVKDFEQGMDEAFKNTKYANKRGENYKDEYKLVKYDDNGNAKVRMKISGSHLTSDYHGKDKDRFINESRKNISRPRAAIFLDSPSGYSLDSKDFDSFAKRATKNKRKKRG